MVEISRSRFPKKALKQYYSSNAGTSSVLTLTEDTTAIEVTTGGKAVALRWIATTDTAASVIGVPGATANWDNAIAADQTAYLRVPIESQTGTQSVMGMNRERGLYRRVAYISLGVGSVMTAEFADIDRI
jgi:hypothetical protein